MIYTSFGVANAKVPACKQGVATGLTRTAFSFGVMASFAHFCDHFEIGRRSLQETSGVMVVAKTLQGFPQIRRLPVYFCNTFAAPKRFALGLGGPWDWRQFSSDRSLEEGGTEKFYFALARGEAGSQSDCFIQFCEIQDGKGESAGADNPKVSSILVDIIGRKILKEYLGENNEEKQKLKQLESYAKIVARIGCMDQMGLHQRVRRRVFKA